MAFSTIRDTGPFEERPVSRNPNAGKKAFWVLFTVVIVVATVKSGLLAAAWNAVVVVARWVHPHPPYNWLW